VSWTILFHVEFQSEFDELPAAIQDELLARLGALAQFGPNLGRPNVDTLEGSDFANMKELRFRLDGLWRFAFAFDPSRRAIILCGGNKLGKKDFYQTLIRTADRRFAAYIASLKTNRPKE
jgi:hypothetical protein